MSSASPMKYGPAAYQIDKDVHENDLDAKILITSHNSRPGLGKTTLAIKMARALDPHGWDAEDKAYMNVYEYMQGYDEHPSGSVLILDEIEALADSRRSNSAENVDLSQAWATKRYRNMITIATLPTTSMLDKRMMEMSDYRINVLRRGTAKAFEVQVPDFPPYNRIWQEPVEGAIDFKDLSDGDKDYQHLQEMKIEFTQVDKEFYEKHEVEKKIEKAKEECRRETRNDLIKSFYELDGISQKNIADVVDVSHPHVNRIINDVTD